MKNKLIFAIIAAAGLMASSAQAQQSYVGVNVGQTEHKLEIDGVGSLKDDDTAFKIYTGYKYDQTFGIEAGYVHHGESEIRGGGLRAAAKPQSIYLAGTATLPLANQFSLFGKLGASYNRVKASATGFGSETESRTSLLAGVGAAYAFTPTVSGVIEYENFGKLADDDGTRLKANTVSIGVRAAF